MHSTSTTYSRLWCSCLLAVAFLFVWTSDATAAGRKGRKVRLSVPIMKASELKPGMKGYGLTTFKGSTPERFDVEVIDVLQKSFPKHPMILIKCSHPVLDKSQIISGMSGSPIYIKDKLIGALAYGWSFTKEPIAGVTPIEWMMEEMAEPEQTKPKGGASVSMEDFKMVSAPVGNELRTFRPVQIPVCLSGFGGLPARAMSKLGEEFHKRGLMIVQGASGSTSAGEIGMDALVPGAPLGVVLMRGDISLTGIGTLTHREKNRIIAFGHPMLFSGQEVAMPVTTAHIHGVLPSQVASFKFGSPSLSVGTLTQDRWPAVAATLGRKCPMVEVTGHIDNPTSGKTEDVRVEMVRNRSLSPMLLSLATSQLLLLEGASWTRFVVDYTLSMEFEKHGKLELQGMDVAWGGFYVSEPSSVLYGLMANQFEPLLPTRISFSLKTIHKRIEARIQRAWLGQLEARPGGEVQLYIRVQPYDGRPKDISFPVSIPAHLDEGKYEIVVGGGGSYAVQRPTPPAESVKDLFTQLKSRYRPTTVVAVLKLPTVGVGFKGKLFEQLPSSVFGTLVSSSSAGVSTFQDGIRVTHETDWYLTGQTQCLKLIVKQSAEDHQ